MLQNFADAWVTSSSVVQTDPADQHPTFDADITATSDGSTKDAYITDSGDIRTNDHQPLTTVDANISGSTVQLLATANNDGSTTIKNAITYYGIGLGDNTPTATSVKISTHSGVTFGGNNETRVDTITATGTTTSILSTQRTLAEFTASA